MEPVDHGNKVAANSLNCSFSFSNEDNLWNFSEENEEIIPLDLYTAASIGDKECIKQLGKVLSVKDLNRANKGGWTALMYACYVGHESLAKLLLELKADANLRTRSGATSLMLAAFGGNKSVAYVLLQHGAAIDMQDVHGQTALFHATHMGHTSILEYLLNTGANTEIRESRSGFTPVLEAAKEGREMVFNILLEHGADLDTRTNKQETVREIAYRYDNMAIVNMIDNLSCKGDLLRSEAGLLCDDLGSEEVIQPEKKVHHWLGGHDSKEQEPDIRDGPEAFAKITGIPFGSPVDRIKNAPLSQGQLPGLHPGFPFPSQYALSPPAPCVLGTSPDDHFFIHSSNTVKSVQLHEGFAQCNLRNNHDGHSTDNQQPNIVFAHHNNRHPSSFPVTTGTPTLAEFLDDLKLTKYLPFFEAKGINFEAFLKLTDENLKEIGIKLFGPRKKMSTAIGKWKSQYKEPLPSRADSGFNLPSLDGSQVEAQVSTQIANLTAQFHQAMANVGQLEAQLVQERNLRSVVEGYLIEEKAKRQHLYKICGDAHTFTIETDSHFKTLKPLVLSILEPHVSENSGLEIPEGKEPKVVHEVINSKFDSIEQVLSHTLKKLELITKEDSSGSLLYSSGSNTSGSSSDCVISKLDKLSV